MSQKVYTLPCNRCGIWLLFEMVDPTMPPPPSLSCWECITKLKDEIVEGLEAIVEDLEALAK